MNDKEMGHGPDEKSGSKSAQGATDPAANRTGQTGHAGQTSQAGHSGQTGQKSKDDWRPEPPGEASGSKQEGKRSPSPGGEKLHGDKFQSASGTRSPSGGQSGTRQH